MTCLTVKDHEHPRCIFTALLGEIGRVKPITDLKEISCLSTAIILALNTKQIGFLEGGMVGVFSPTKGVVV